MLSACWTLGVWCFSGFASLFPLIVAALYWRRLTKAGAYASILTAIGTWSYLFYQSDFAKNPSYSVTLHWGEESYPMMPVVVMFFSSLLAMVVVSLATRPPSEKTLTKFFPEPSTK